ncbi:MAG: YdeI/OmpD-associated family protein [Saprospiraceae bacterium]
MNKINPKIDAYLIEGCGRCPLGNTLQCKVHKWPEELKALRAIALSSGLTEELKWSVPCYTYAGKNIAIVAAFNDYAAISFFKGALLQDTESILKKPGENTQLGRLAKFTNVNNIVQLEPVIKAYLLEAIELEKSNNLAPIAPKPSLSIIEELQQKFEVFPDLKVAFEALTPGRQRGYILFFSAPKQTNTRVSRIEKCIPKILDGKGINE